MSEQAAEPTSANSEPLNVESSVSTPSEAMKALEAAAQGLDLELAAAAEKAAGAVEPAAASATEAKAEIAVESTTEVDAGPAKPPASETEPGKVIVMAPRERGFADHDAISKPETVVDPAVNKRRVAAIAAVAAFATVAGALGGAIVTASFMQGGTQAVASNDGQGAIAASLSRIDADMQALKAGLEHTSKLGLTQFNRTTDRLDRLERAQAEPAARLAKLSEAVDKIHALPVPPSVAPVASKEVTGTIAPAQQQAAVVPATKNDAKVDAKIDGKMDTKNDAKTDTKADTKSDSKVDAKTEVGRLPTLEGWSLRDVAYGGALINGRRGVYEVYAGDYIPGVGRIDAIRRQDGRWVVVTSRGLIVAR